MGQPDFGQLYVNVCPLLIKFYEMEYINLEINLILYDHQTSTISYRTKVTAIARIVSKLKWLVAGPMGTGAD